jgi:phosphoribosylformylglycinamidine synthase
LSGKDSMYVDGHLVGRYGESHKVSAPETMQFATISVVPDIERVVSMDAKIPGDRVYVAGLTRDELGASEYYAHFGYVGRNVPQVRPEEFTPVYRAVGRAIEQGLVASVHGIYRGGLGVHLAMVAIGGNLGLDVDARRVPAEGVDRLDTLLFSESAGRFILTADPARGAELEALFAGLPLACIGSVTQEAVLTVTGPAGRTAASLKVGDMRASWKKPFGHLI